MPQPADELYAGCEDCLDLATFTPASGDFELGFSWSKCEICGSKLGGDRFLLVKLPTLAELTEPFERRFYQHLADGPRT